LVGGWIATSYGYHLDLVLSGIGRMIAAVMFMTLLKPFDLKRVSLDRFRRSGVS